MSNQENKQETTASATGFEDVGVLRRDSITRVNVTTTHTPFTFRHEWLVNVDTWEDLDNLTLSTPFLTGCWRLKFNVKNVDRTGATFNVEYHSDALDRGSARVRVYISEENGVIDTAQTRRGDLESFTRQGTVSAYDFPTSRFVVRLVADGETIESHTQTEDVLNNE